MKKQINKTSILFISMLIAINSLFATERPNIDFVPVSPNAASLGLYGTIPTTPYTGQANVQVPIFNMNLDGKEFPITLSYHTTGTKVAEEASWVGLGWTLNAGGCIVRQVYDSDDFNRWGIPTGNYFNVNAPWHTGSTTITDQNMGEYLPFVEKQKDSEPDMFYYNFGGYSGSMFFDASKNEGSFNAKPTFQSTHAPLNVTYDVISDKWVAIDQEGYTYYFGTKETTSGYSKIYQFYLEKVDRNKLVQNSWSNDGVVTSWQLDSIVSPFNNKISFQYKTEEIYTPISIMEEALKDAGGGEAHQPTETVTIDTYHRFIYSYSKIKQCILSKINFSGGEINFSTTDRTDIEYVNDQSNSKKKVQKLSMLTIKNLANEIIKTTKFDYKYLLGGTLSTYGYDDRLLLTSVYDMNNTKKENVYNFEYNEGKLPSKSSLSMDAWGYYNGSKTPVGDESFKIIPTIHYTSQSQSKKVYFLKEGADRSFNTGLCQIGTLKKIIYPTKGYTQFEYEGHEFEEPCTMTLAKNVTLGYVDNYSSITGYNGPYKEYTSSPFEVTIADEIVGLRFNRFHDEPHPDDRPAVTPVYFTKLQKWNGTKYIDFESLTAVNIVDEIPEDRIINKIETGKYRILLYVENIYVERESTISVSIIGSSIKPRENDYKGAGLRIKSIKNILPDGKTETKKYKYSPGILMVPANFYSPVKINQSSANTANWIKTTCLLMQSTPYLPFTNTVRNHLVGYKTVTEYYEDNNSSGYMIYYYHCKPDILPDTFLAGTPTTPYFFNGLLSAIHIYNEKNKLKKTEQNYYSNKRQENVLAYKIRIFRLNPMHPSETYAAGHFYNIESQEFRLDRKVITTIEDNGAQTSNTIEYTYDPTYLLVNSTKTKNSKNQINEEKIKYPFNYSDKENTLMKNKFMIGIPIEKISLLDNRVVAAVKTEYKDTLDICVPRFIKEINVKTPSNLSNYSNFYKIAESFSAYNKNGKLLEYNSINDQKLVFLWGYNNQYPIAQIVGATYKDVKDKLTEEYINSLATDSNITTETGKNIRSKLDGLSNIFITTYTYKPLVGVTSITDPSEKVTYFDYDSIGRLKESYIKNGNSKEILEVYEYNYANK